MNPQFGFRLLCRGIPACQSWVSGYNLTPRERKELREARIAYRGLLAMAKQNPAFAGEIRKELKEIFRYFGTIRSNSPVQGDVRYVNLHLSVASIKYALREVD